MTAATDDAEPEEGKTPYRDPARRRPRAACWVAAGQADDQEPAPAEASAP
jgi:hypothetical protein